MTAPLALATKDNARAQLLSGISPSTLSIQLKSGEGASFPQPYTDEATSGGTGTVLNCTGISAAIGGSAAVGKFIWNKTDGSIARIKSVATDSVTTTRLLGGTDNTWQNGDTWCIDPFVLTFEKVSTNAYGVQETTQFEEALITARSSDILSVPSGGRGYNGTVANTFDADDFVYLHVTSPIVERLIDLIGEVAEAADDNQTNTESNDDDIADLQDDAPTWLGTVTGTNTLTATASPTRTAYAAGQRFAFIVANDNTGAVTLNVDGLGGKTIKRLDGATDLAAGDLQEDQLVEVRYDGTNFQMTSPPGQAPATTPVGSMVLWTTDSAPSGWLLCYGQAVSRTTYADLFAVISTTFGSGDGSTTFNLPDMRGRLPLGQDDMGGSSANRVTATEADNLGQAAGVADGAHTHGIARGGANVGAGSSTVTTNVTDSTSVMPPYLTLNYIIKA